ncbi:MAG: hypothetical protein ABSC08_18470 [Bryobacteraceae bacterium]|jgi:hypothetical protein
MKRLTSILGIAAAVLTVAVAVVGPLVWFGAFNRAAASTKLRIDPLYTGGEPARVLERTGYQIVVYKPVPKRALLSESGGFVQLVWKPATALPPHVSEEIDIDGDGRPDVVASFDVPRDPGTELRLTVKPLNARLQPLNGIGKESFSALIARVNDSIVVRVPQR